MNGHELKKSFTKILSFFLLPFLERNRKQEKNVQKKFVTKKTERGTKNEKDNGKINFTNNVN